MACRIIIRCGNFDWASQEGDMIKRVYWTCVISEDLFHLEFDLPDSGICALEDEVPLPNFHEGQTAYNQSTICDEYQSLYQYHFLAMVTLRKVFTRIAKMVYSAPVEPDHSESWSAPSLSLVSELARQLDSWRAVLPWQVQWFDEDVFGFPRSDSAESRPRKPLFSYDLEAMPIGHQHNIDVAIAQLRTRFYQARYLLFRPFVYKALHFPALMTDHDSHYASLAMESICRWPILMSPPKDKKRLVPHHFAWTQNCISILLIIRMTAANEDLEGMCFKYVERTVLRKTAVLMLQWLRDLKQIDGIAEWSLQLLEPLFVEESEAGDD
ncbi:hypothetical protein WHR41_09548 [Cladosporium halotolerans]|uniref:Transcription factor domain-containing protein n=1 Tax=Cladosporium halotolerans TaxID=1052096 RepID=A0AB34KAC5_9PEZI